MSEKKYEFKIIGAEDVFTMSSIISKIGVNKFASCFQGEDIQKMVAELRSDKELKTEDIKIATGVEIVTKVVQIILEGMPKCKEDIYTILASTSNLTLEEVKGLDGVTFLNMIADFVKKEEFMDFFKVASKFAKGEN